MERLANFIQNVKVHGPTMREMIEYILQVNKHHKADALIQGIETLTHNNMINVLQ